MERRFNAILSFFLFYQWKFPTLSQKAVVIIILTPKVTSAEPKPLRNTRISKLQLKSQINITQDLLHFVIAGDFLIRFVRETHVKCVSVHSLIISILR